MRSGLRSLVAAVVVLTVMATTAAAQNRLTQLTVSGFPLSDTETSIAELDAGSIALGSTDFTVDLLTNSGNPYRNRYTNIEVICAAPCPVDVTRLQWRRADQATWNTLSDVNWTSIEVRLATIDGANDPWSQTVFWRYLVDWTTSPPAAAKEYRIQFRLTTTQNAP